MGTVTGCVGGSSMSCSLGPPGAALALTAQRGLQEERRAPPPSSPSSPQAGVLPGVLWGWEGYQGSAQVTAMCFCFSFAWQLGCTVEPNIFSLHRQKIFAGSGKRRPERKQASFTTSGNPIRREALREWEGADGLGGDKLCSRRLGRELISALSGC